MTWSVLFSKMLMKGQFYFCYWYAWFWVLILAKDAAKRIQKANPQYSNATFRGFLWLHLTCVMPAFFGTGGAIYTLVLHMKTDVDFVAATQAIWMGTALLFDLAALPFLIKLGSDYCRYAEKPAPQRTDSSKSEGPKKKA